VVSRPALFVLLLAAFAATVILSWAARTSASAREEEPVSETTTPVAPPPPVTPETRPKARPEPRPKKPRWRVAIVRRSVPLRARPNGHVIARVSNRTEFGDQRVLSIARQRGPWLGVVATELPNGELAWVHVKHSGLDFRRTRYSLHADLSGRWLELRRGGRRIRRISVAIGRPGSETPTGRFAVTDKLSGYRYGPYYGCCILALNGQQPNLPPGWTGGNRLAIHGTDAPGTIGAAASAGCLRAGDADLRVLMRRVPLGTPVFIRA
jgi:L,D-transpeptidase catalytic domain